MWSKIPSEVGLWLPLLLQQRDILLLQHDLRQDSDAHLATKFWQTEICMIEWQVDVDHRCLVVQTVRRQCCLHCHINIVQQKKLKKIWTLTTLAQSPSSFSSGREFLALATWKTMWPQRGRKRPCEVVAGPHSWFTFDLFSIVVVVLGKCSSFAILSQLLLKDFSR